MTDEQILSNLKIGFFDFSHDPYCFFNDKLEFVHINKAYEKIFKLKREDVIGKQIIDVFPTAKETGRDEQYRTVLRTGVPLTTDAFTNHPNSGPIFTRVVAFRIDNYLAISLSTITDLKNLIETLDNFVYKASHDMKSPVNSILGLINLAQESAGDSETGKYIKIINKEMQRLNGLLGQIIETERVKKGTLKLQPVDIIKTVDEVILSISHIPGFSSVTILKNIEPILDFYTDELLFISIIQNLIDNGIKYRNVKQTNQFVKIKIRLEKTFLVIEVEDNGVGIPLNMQGKIFTVFFRVNNHIPGSGLGLYSVKDSIQKLNGVIEFRSQESLGTCFIVRLPQLTDAIPNL